MSEFSLIKRLQEKTDKTPIPTGHKYETLEVDVEGEKVTVHIPLKEAEQFTIMCNDSEPMNKYSFNKIMREFRGIRG